ncbi:PIN domain-like protein [Favolaschia claudopus]|uniref:PIN domain-like protein n=1 Tax=Favolaschia claudopus TaxID=2862362 RepID=A0AAW0DRW4_9AGAR
MMRALHSVGRLYLSTFALNALELSDQAGYNPLPNRSHQTVPNLRQGIVHSLPSTMGIPGYWKLVDQASEMHSLKVLASQEGRRGPSGMRVGIDACLWITQCQAVFHKPIHAQSGRNPELRALFFKAAAISNAGLDAKFVFDGKHRPSQKRNKRVKAKPHWLVEEFMQMITFFGFDYYTAPGEAEAELARLNRLGEIDAVLTDDGDAALFGARCIIRSRDKKDKDKITVYNAEAIARHPEVGLTQGGILLLAVLGGGDYDTAGLPDCGMGTAHALARCGYGDSLLLAAQTLCVDDLEQFLVGWRQEIRTELATNSQGFMKSKRKALSAKIPDDFPSTKILKLYVNPTTSWSDGFLPPNTISWNVKLPRLPELGRFCHSKFGWKPLDIVNKFKKHIFPGMCIRRLNMPLDPQQELYNHVVLGRINDEHPGLSSFLAIVAAKEVRPSLSVYKMKISIATSTRRALSLLRAPAAAAGSPSATIMLWVPAKSVERYFPLLAARFNGKPIIAPALARAARVVMPPPQPQRAAHSEVIDLTIDDAEGEGDDEEVMGGDIIDLTRD